VAPGCFSPPPKVDSVVVSYTRRENPDESDYKELNTFTRRLFNGKRKQIRTVLKTSYPLPQVDEALAKAQIEPNLRAEAMSYEQVLNLYRSIN